MGLFDNIEARVGIRNEFSNETKMNWQNHQDRPSVAYVLWLEDEKIRLEKQLLSADTVKVLNGLNESIDISVACSKNDVDKIKDKNSLAFAEKEGERNGLLIAKSLINLAIQLCSPQKV